MKFLKTLACVLIVVSASATNTIIPTDTANPPDIGVIESGGGKGSVALSFEDGATLPVDNGAAEITVQAIGDNP
jgi:hypothetical protein